jgi:hypothetical protein
MKTKQVSLFGFAVLLLAAMCIVTACDTGTGGGGSSGGANPLSGTTWTAPHIKSSQTGTLTLKFTSDSEFQLIILFPNLANDRAGTYTLTGTTLALSYTDGGSTEAVYMDDKITLSSYEGSGPRTFTKQ